MPELFTDRAVPVPATVLVLREGVAAIAELDPKCLRRKLSHGGPPPQSFGGFALKFVAGYKAAITRRRSVK
ncbi:MAG TPA: hypothetical protein VED24_03985 [Candidatus Acidoferrum sp.]|nr:hypothetical protein [Candidatus Acidoferrum sp.]